jgi:DeoR/GlpR family transcriptional regulator of sugar metabolism
MLAESRRRRLLDLIAHQGFATLDELVKSAGVSESTVRRDLEALESGGTVKRTHGGAISVSASPDGRGLPALEDRVASARLEKESIGRAAAELVEDGDSVLLDGGTTTFEVARSLLGRDGPLQVVTNSLPIAQMLSANKSVDLILIGGYVYPRTGVALGPLAIDMMRKIRVRKAILGAGGVVADGIYNSNLLLVETERQMMSCGQEVIIVADHTKFGRLTLARLCGLDEVHRVVSDSGLGAEYRGLLEAAGVRLHLADSEAKAPNGQTASNGANAIGLGNPA